VSHENSWLGDVRPPSNAFSPATLCGSQSRRWRRCNIGRPWFGWVGWGRAVLSSELSCAFNGFEITHPSPASRDAFSQLQDQNGPTAHGHGLDEAGGRSSTATCPVRRRSLPRRGTPSIFLLSMKRKCTSTLLQYKYELPSLMISRYK
jgi:hypothetical protein